MTSDLARSLHWPYQLKLVQVIILTSDPGDLDVKGPAELAAMVIADRAAILSTVAIGCLGDDKRCFMGVVQFTRVFVPSEPAATS